MTPWKALYRSPHLKLATDTGETWKRNSGAARSLLDGLRYRQAGGVVACDDQRNAWHQTKAPTGQHTSRPA